MHTVEALLVCHVIDQQDPHCASVVCSGDCSEALLTRGVPYLQLHAFAIQVDGSDLEVYADGGDETGGKAVLAEAQQTA